MRSCRKEVSRLQEMRMVLRRLRASGGSSMSVSSREQFEIMELSGFLISCEIVAFMIS